MWILWKMRKVSSSAEEWGQDSNDCKMHLCCLVCLCVGYLQLGKSTDSSIIVFFDKFSKESKVLSNGNISAAVNLIHFRGHRRVIQGNLEEIHSFLLSELLIHIYEWNADYFSNIPNISLCHIRFVSGSHRSDQIYFSLDFKGHILRYK